MAPLANTTRGRVTSKTHKVHNRPAYQWMILCAVLAGRECAGNKLPTTSAVKNSKAGERRANSIAARVRERMLTL